MVLQQFITVKNKLYLHSLSIKTKIQLLKLKHTFISILFGTLLLLSISMQAQKGRLNLQEHDQNRYHFGFFVALNQMDFSIKTNEEFIGSFIDYNLKEYQDFANVDNILFYGVHSTPSTGFTLGIIGNLKITPYLDLRFAPSLSFGERILNYSFQTTTFGTEPEIINISKHIISTNVDLPFYLKYKSKRAGNFRAYLLSGVKFTIDMAANSDKNKDSTEGLLILKTSDIAFEVGVGADYYFNFFKFSLEVKMGYGFNNILASEDNIFADGIKSIHSKTFQISLTFE